MIWKTFSYHLIVVTAGINIRMNVFSCDSGATRTAIVCKWNELHLPLPIHTWFWIERMMKRNALPATFKYFIANIRLKHQPELKCTKTIDIFRHSQCWSFDIYGKLTPICHHQAYCGWKKWKMFPRNLFFHGPLTRCVKSQVAHAPGMPGTFSPPPRVSYPDMHHGTCVTHVP